MSMRDVKAALVGYLRTKGWTDAASIPSKSELGKTVHVKAKHPKTKEEKTFWIRWDWEFFTDEVSDIEPGPVIGEPLEADYWVRANFAATAMHIVQADALRAFSESGQTDGDPPRVTYGRHLGGVFSIETDGIPMKRLLDAAKRRDKQREKAGDTESASVYSQLIDWTNDWEDCKAKRDSLVEAERRAAERNRCEQDHGDPESWAKEPDTHGRQGFFTIYCRACGRFIGYQN